MKRLNRKQVRELVEGILLNEAPKGKRRDRLVIRVAQAYEEDYEMLWDAAVMYLSEGDLQEMIESAEGYMDPEYEFKEADDLEEDIPPSI